jgi:hypothetical protein
MSEDQPAIVGLRSHVTCIFNVCIFHTLMLFPPSFVTSVFCLLLRFRFQDLSYISPAFDWSLCFWFYSNILCLLCPLFLCLLSTFIREGGLVWVVAPLDYWFLPPLLWVLLAGFGIWFFKIPKNQCYAFLNTEPLANRANSIHN